MNRRGWRQIGAAIALIGAPMTATSGATYEMSMNPFACRYGNWGGAGYSDDAEGGSAYGSAVPVDQMDEAFRQHDRDIADANSRWEPRYRAARTTTERTIVLALWTAELREANSRCVACVAALPALVVHSDGSDTWGGQSIPKSTTWRLAFRAGAVALINGNLPRP